MAFILLSVSAASSPDMSVTLLNYGTFTAESNNTDTSIYIKGEVDAVKGMKLIDQTDQIDGSVGVRFGYSFITHFDPKYSQATLKMITRYPEMKNPKTGKTKIQDTFPFQVANGLPEYRGWYFGEDWEVVKGEWYFDIYFDNKLIHTKMFIVK